MKSCETSRSDRRRDAILAIAREAFFRQGYAGTSMSAIAAELGGSKTTLWSYFPNKHELFMAVADNLVTEYMDSIKCALVPDTQIEATLSSFGQKLLEALLTPPMMALMRLVIGEAGRFPELGAMFDKRGLGHGWITVQAYLDQGVRTGQLRAADTFYAAQHFIALCQSGCFQRQLMSGGAMPDPAEIARDAEMAVRAFMAAYGARS